MRRSNLKYLLLLFLCISAISCSQKDASSPSTPQFNSGGIVNIKAGNFTPGQLETHYLKHGYRFGSITREEYLERARALLNAPAEKDILAKTRPNGDILRYRVSTGEFAVMARDGRIRTYFKTDYQYWMKQ